MCNFLKVWSISLKSEFKILIFVNVCKCVVVSVKYLCSFKAYCATTNIKFTRALKANLWKQKRHSKMKSVLRWYEHQSHIRLKIEHFEIYCTALNALISSCCCLLTGHCHAGTDCLLFSEMFVDDVLVGTLCQMSNLEPFVTLCSRLPQVQQGPVSQRSGCGSLWLVPKGLQESLPHELGRSQISFFLLSSMTLWGTGPQYKICNSSDFLFSSFVVFDIVGLWLILFPESMQIVHFIFYFKAICDIKLCVIWFESSLPLDMQPQKWTSITSSRNAALRLILEFACH